MSTLYNYNRVPANIVIKISSLAYSISSTKNFYVFCKNVRLTNRKTKADPYATEGPWPKHQQVWASTLSNHNLTQEQSFFFAAVHALEKKYSKVHAHLLDQEEVEHNFTTLKLYRCIPCNWLRKEYSESPQILSFFSFSLFVVYRSVRLSVGFVFVLLLLYILFYSFMNEYWVI